MANKYHGQVSAVGKVPSGRKAGAGVAGSMNEKPGFPGADLPGKSQPKDRSGGVKRCQTYPNSKGI